jgi:hypothetical protein
MSSTSVPTTATGANQRCGYEVQAEYEKAEENDKFHGMGSIYGFLAPADDLPEPPGEWESYDVTLVGRTVTVVRNGPATRHYRQRLDSHEGKPGSIYIQGDHTGGMKYRNIAIGIGALT